MLNKGTGSEWVADKEWSQDPETEDFRRMLERRQQEALASLLSQCREGRLSKIRKLVGKYDELTEIINATLEADDEDDK